MTCLLLAVFGPSLQAATPVYDVEIIVFRNKLMTDAGEQWPSPAPGRQYSGKIFPQGEFTVLDRSLYQLDGVQRGLRNSSGYEVLLHRAWRQAGYDTAHAIAFPVKSSVGSGGYRVEGGVKLVLEHYLHLDVDLFLVAAGYTPQGQYPVEAQGAPVFELREKRRVRSREMHYFDHPRFGMIAMVTPYAAPEEEPEPEPAEEEEAPQAVGADEPAYSPNDDQLTR